MTQEIGDRLKRYGLLILSMLAAYAAVWMFTNKTPWMHSVYCPYALQAERWLSGHLDLGQDYSWLELAVYEGKYYVSFPPLPTLFVLPFVMLFGVEGTPEYLIATVASIVGAAYMFRLFSLYCRRWQGALLWALLATIGSNFLLIGYNGDVWLLAQTCAYMFTAAALYYAVTDAERDGRWPLLWLACAVGCRPFNAVYLPVVVYFLLRKLRRNGLTFAGGLRKHWTWLIAPACVGGFYMALNALRFGNPFQFGHDYLPEFTRSPDHVQFSLSYIPKHFFGKLFRLPCWSEENLLLFPKDGFAFYIASPIYALGFVCLAERCVRRMRGGNALPAAPLLLIGACVSLHLLILCAHGTMGGIQWGLRYTIDAIPAAALGVALLLEGDEERGIAGFLLMPTFVFGLCLNLVGTLAILNDWPIFL